MENTERRGGEVELDDIKQKLGHDIDIIYQAALQHQLAGDDGEAAFLYHKVLAINPYHAAANHQLGIIEVHTKSVLVALPRFEVAVQASPNLEQFWVSYIDALMMTGNLDLAVAAIENGQAHGLTLASANMLAAELVPLLEQRVYMPVFDIQHRAQKVAKEKVPKAKGKVVKGKVLKNSVEQSQKKLATQFLIVAPDYSDKSAGISVLHELCDSLNELGHHAALILMGSGTYTYSNDAKVYAPNFQWYELAGEDEYKQFIRDGIVIYPEIVTGNPLGAARVVRYMLNSEGYAVKNKMDVSERDFILSYSHAYHQNPHAILTKLPLNPLFNSDNTLSALERTLDVTYFGKGVSYNDCFVMPNSLEITRQWPKTKAELALVLKNTRYFYTWDNRTATISDAIFCGAIPVFLSPAPFDSFDALGEGELAKRFKISATINDENVQVSCPADLDSTLAQYKQSYVEMVYSYNSQLLLVVEQILKHFHMRQINTPNIFSKQ